MIFRALLARGQTIAENAEEKRKDRIMNRLQLPPGVEAQIVPNGVEIFGKAVIHRFVSDDNFRNNIS